jgi:DNA polymerase III epsilon subunit-like protein
MTKTYSGLVNLNGNMMAAIDYETTGKRPGYHEIIQIGIVPLNSDLRPITDIRPFYTTVKPEHPGRQEKGAGYVHGLDINELVLHAPEPGRVKDLLVEWFNRLELPFGKKLTPLAQNWPFECGFTKAWLGVELTDELFHSHARDSMQLALNLNDRAAFAGAQIPFARVGLTSLCRKLGITNDRPHDALHDAFAEAEVYRALLHFEIM